MKAVYHELSPSVSALLPPPDLLFSFLVLCMLNFLRMYTCSYFVVNFRTAGICQRVYANIIDVGINTDGYKESGTRYTVFQLKIYQCCR